MAAKRAGQFRVVGEGRSAPPVQPRQPQSIFGGLLTIRSKYPSIAETVREVITLAPGETAQAHFQSWLKEKLAASRFCATHPRTPLVLARTHSDFLEVYEEYRYGFPATLQTKPGVFRFEAAFRCPACQCARAKCPPEFYETSFDTFATSTPESAAMLARARDFAAQVNERGCGFALFLGWPGTGKTRLACNIIRALENPAALYARWGALTNALRATYGRRGDELRRELQEVKARLHSARSLTYKPDDADEERERALEAALENPLDAGQGVRFLVLDELGTHALANDERLLLDEVIKHRYDHRKPTILISNLPPKGTGGEPGFKQLVGDALADRISEATGDKKFILQFDGESYRRTTGASYLDGLR